MGETARGDDRRLVAQLREDALDQAIYLVCFTVNDACLNSLRGIAADGRMGVDEFGGSKLRGMLEQCRCRCFHTRRNHAADELAVAVDDLDVGGGAEVDHHDWRAVQGLGGDGIGHAVGADFRRAHVFGLEQESSRFGVADERLGSQHALERGFPPDGERRHDRRQRRSFELFHVQLVGSQQRRELQAQLVGGVHLLRGDAPHVQQLGAVVDAEDRLGVSHVDCQQLAHGCSFIRLKTHVRSRAQPAR